MIRSSHHRFTEGKPFLTKLIIFYNEITGMVNKGREESGYLHESLSAVSPVTSLGEAAAVWAG